MPIVLEKKRVSLGASFIFEVSVVRRSTGTGVIRENPFKGQFSKISGIREEIETVAWRDGRNPFRVRKGIGTFGGGIVTLERGIAHNITDLFSWINSIRTIASRLERSQIINHPDDPMKNRGGDSRRTINTILTDGPARSSSRGIGIPLADLDIVFGTVTISVGSCDNVSQFRSKDEEPAKKDPAPRLPWERTPPPDPRKEKEIPTVRKVELFKAWPVAYQIADLDAKSSEVAIESLSLAFDMMNVLRG